MTDIFASVKEVSTFEVAQAFFPDLQLKRDGSGRYKAPCLFHDDSTPSFTVYSQSFKCFGCGEHGSNIDLLIKANLASSPIEAAKAIAEKFGITVEQKGPYKQQSLTLSNYAQYTGVPENFLVKTFKVRETSSGLEMPYMDGTGKEVAIRTRYRLKAKDGVKWRKGDSLILYGLWQIERIRAAERVLLVEGESDTHVLWFNRIPALGVPGANNFKKKWATLFLELPEIVVVQEPDEAGKGFVEDITCALKQAGYEGQVRAVTLPEKDTRDLWLKHGDRFKEELEQAISSTPLIVLDSIIEVTTKKKKESVPADLEGRSIHPALHIEPGFSSIGIIEREGNKHVFSVVTSSGATHPAEDIKDVLLTEPQIHPGLSGRWQRLNHAQSLPETVTLLIHKMRELVCFEDERWYSVIALWSAGTYLFPALPTYPYLQLTGEKGSGKTKVQDILECVAFNALKVVNPTPAVLFRVIHTLRPTLLIDEAEKVGTKDTKEVTEIINVGYKRGATVPRCEGERNVLRFFEVYGPKCLASIRGLGDTTEDRCIAVVMSKPPQEDTRQNQVVNPLDTDWVTIRNGFYQLPLTQADSILTSLDTGRLPGWLRARDRELWFPLLSLALLADGESGLGLFEDVLGLASESVQDKGLTFEAETILGLLESMLDGKETLRVHPVDLVSDLESSFNRKGLSPKWVANKLRGLGFRKANPPRDRAGIIYEVGAKKLAQLRCRYTPLELNTQVHTQPCTPPKPLENKGEY